MGRYVVKSSRILVIKPLRRRGAVAFALIPGCLCGLIFNVILPGSTLAMLGPGYRWPLIVALVSIPIVYGLVTASSVLLMRTAAFLGAVAWATMFVTTTIFNELSFRDGGAFFIVTPMKSFFLPVLIGSSVLGLIGAFVHAVLFVARRAWLFELVEDDGDHCLRCGYQIGSSAIARCPECGQLLESMRYRWKRSYGTLAWSRRWARVMLAVLLIAAAVPAGWIITTRTVPAFPFMWRFRDGEYLVDNMIYIWLDKESKRTLVLTYDWEDGPDIDALTAYDGHFFTVGSDSSINPGNPFITWVFSRAQADFVLKHGLPDSFLRELDETRAKHDANPVPPPGTRLRLNVSFDPATEPR